MSTAVTPTRLATLLAPALDPAVRAEYTPTYRALADALRVLIADGQIPVGTRLPSERVLTAALSVSRTTVSGAYAVLRDRGYLTSQRGSGSHAALPAGIVARRAGLRFNPGAAQGVIDLTCAALRAPSGMIEAAEAAIASAPEYLDGTGYLADGLPELRDAIAARYTERGLDTEASDIVVTTGAMSAFSGIVRALTRPGSAVLIETPTYPNFLPILDQIRARLAPIPVSRDGWDIGAVASTVRSSGARLAVLLPDFHNPTGHLMSDEQRVELAAILGRDRVTAIVDETVAEIALDRDDPMPLPFAAHHRNTITIGSASKSHWGGLRVGWYRADAALRGCLAGADQIVDLCAPTLEQLTLLHLMRRSINVPTQRRSSLREARDVTASAVRELIPDADFVLPRGGLSLWVELPDPIARAVAVAAEEEGLLISSGPRFAAGGGMERWLRLPYVLAADEMPEAVARLARAVERVRAGPKPLRRQGAHGIRNRRVA